MKKQLSNSILPSLRSHTLIKLSSLLALLFIGIISFSCQNQKTTIDPDPYQHIQDQQASTLLQKAINQAGGLDNWNRIQELYFKKYTALYEESGVTEAEARQTHQYQYQPKEKVRISWNIDTLGYLVTFQDGQLKRLINGQPDASANLKSLMNSLLSATFVIGIPFKLLDEGAELSYAGSDILEDGQEVEVLKVTYNPAEHNNHSTPDTWWHYFSKKDFKQVGYMVQHADHFSYVKNLSYVKADGFLFPKERESYRVDSLRNLLYLRAKYEYSNFAVKF